MDFQSQIARIISKAEEYHHGFLAARVMEGLNKFVRDKLAQEEKAFSLEQEMELTKKIEASRSAESMRELDMYLFGYEQMIRELVNLNPGELEFRASTEIQEVAKENAELLGALREKHPDDMKERGMEDAPKEPKEGKLLKFPPEGGRH